MGQARVPAHAFGVGFGEGAVRVEARECGRNPDDSGLNPEASGLNAEAPEAIGQVSGLDAEVVLMMTMLKFDRHFQACPCLRTLKTRSELKCENMLSKSVWVPVKRLVGGLRPNTSEQHWD